VDQEQEAVEVAVLLAGRPDQLGEWLADARAFEAAGADALWVDLDPASGLDPLALLAALAVLTHRALLAAALPAADRAPEALARTLATVGRLGRRRVALVADAERLDELAALAPGFERFRRLPEEPVAFERPREGDVTERWVQVPPPEGREAWRAALADAAAAGAHGLLVPAGPRLLDILRNPDAPEGRQDLHLAQG
jgi:hypothetical protein